MGDLEVFDTRGSQLYPDDGGSAHPEYREWANRVFFDLRPHNPDGTGRELTVFARFRIDGRKRSTYLRFLMDENGDLGPELKRLVKRKLVQGANWEVLDTGAEDDPGFLFPNLFWREDPRHPRSFGDTTREALLEPTSPILNEVLHGSDHRFVTLTRDFRYATTVIEHYLATIPRIRLTIDLEATEAGQLVIACDDSIEPAVEIASESTKLLEDTARRLADERRQEELSRVEDALGHLAALSTPAGSVSERLSAALNEHFPDINVLGPEDPDYEAEYRRAAKRIEELEARLEAMEAAEESEDETSLFGGLFGS
mgnify:CR=1 FL=1